MCLEHSNSNLKLTSFKPITLSDYSVNEPFEPRNHKIYHNITYTASESKLNYRLESDRKFSNLYTTDCDE